MYKEVFRMPTSVTIKQRTSSVTNAFVSGIIPTIEPTEEEIKRVLDALEIDVNHVVCAYCGDACTEWDHFNPLVLNKKPTGYISEINNLVPACGKCNESKGNKPWKKWMLSSAKKSPYSRKIPDLEKRIELLENFEKEFKPRKIDFEKTVGNELWNKHWNNCQNIHNMMNESQKLSNQIKNIIKQSIE